VTAADLRRALELFERGYGAPFDPADEQDVAALARLIADEEDRTTARFFEARTARLRREIQGVER
jgi:hypothetical protein